MPNIKQVRILTFSVSIILIALGFFAPDLGARYNIGDWKAPIGIEYVLDHINYTIVIYLNIILFLFSLSFMWLSTYLEESTANQYKPFIYAILLIAHTGFMGIALTGDIFNLYVFIEISSIASYSLIYISNNKYGIVASLEYLIIGSIAATFILLGIGMIFSICGTLNMHDMMGHIAQNTTSKILNIGIIIFFIGVLIKLASFPLHFWMVKAYTYTSSSILMYIASISSVMGFYILLRFIYSVIGYDLFISMGLNSMIGLVATLGIITGAILALRAENFREIILFSTTSNIGYILLMLISTNNVNMILQYALADGCFKFFIFGFITLKTSDKNSFGISVLAIINIFSNLGLPITVGFFNKVNLLMILLEQSSYIYFALAIIASVIAINYNFRMIFYITNSISRVRANIKIILPMGLLTMLSFGLIFYGKI
ncbi:MAG UNVERIFIED_CONTAM: cation:proton antiporter [Rickettsiaceae bacterium]